MKTLKKIQKTETGSSLIVLIILLVIIIGVAGFAVYQRQHKTTTRVTKTTANSTQKTAFLKSEKIYLTYPSNWKFEYSTFLPSDSETTTGSDNASLTAPDGLIMGVTAGAGAAPHGVYQPPTLFAVSQALPIRTLGGNYYLITLNDNGQPNQIYVSRVAQPTIDGSSNPSYLDYDLIIAKNAQATTPDPISGKDAFINIGLSYDAKARTNGFKLANIQKDSYYQAALTIIESMHY